MAAQEDHVIDWLLSIDPSIAWQVQRDILKLPVSVYEKTRARIPTEGWGAKLLSFQDKDGQWGGGAFVPKDVPWSDWKTQGQPFTATAWALGQLREFGLDPDSDIAKTSVRQIGEVSRWDDGSPFWQGETEECINGRTVGDGVYFGVNMSKLADRLLTENQPDGGWNCERCNGSRVSSFDATINVLEGLALLPGKDIGEARKRAEEYLLQRKLFRKLSDGSVVDEKYLQLLHPTRWHYDILRALDYFRLVNRRDARLAEAIEIIRSKRSEDGKWILERDLRGKSWFKMGEVGESNAWITLKAIRVLKWWDEWIARSKADLNSSNQG